MHANEPKYKGQSRITRRYFLLTGIAGGVLATSTPLIWRIFTSASAKVTNNTILIRNPAFVKQRWVDKIVLVATKTDGTQIVYSIDDGASFLWEQTPTTDDFRRKRTSTVGELLDKAVERFSSHDSSMIRDDALGFIQEALVAGIFANSKMKIAVTSRGVKRV